MKPGFDTQDLLKALCVLDFNSIVPKLESSFNINTLANSIANNNASTFDAQTFIKQIQFVVTKVENLTKTDYVMFGNNNIAAQNNMINTSRLIELLTDQYGSILSDDSLLWTDYLAVSVSM